MGANAMYPPQMMPQGYYPQPQPQAWGPPAQQPQFQPQQLPSFTPQQDMFGPANGPAPHSPGGMSFGPEPAPAGAHPGAQGGKGPSAQDEAEQMKALEALLAQLGGGGGAPQGAPGGHGGGGGDPMAALNAMGLGGGAPAPQQMSTQSAGGYTMQPDGSVWEMNSGSSGRSIFSLKNLGIAALVAGAATIGTMLYKGKLNFSAVKQAVTP